MNSFRNEVGEVVSFRVSPSSPCPCGSKRAANSCCLTQSGFRKAPAATTPPLPKTSASHDSCYASKLADCSSSISGEHYISENLLKHLNRTKSLTVSGFPWLSTGQQRIVSPKSLTANVLCTRHNSALSGLDDTAVRFFEAFNEDRAAGSGQQLLHLFCGHDLERWLLKILCGMASSGNLDCHEEDRAIPKHWLEILFGTADFTNEQGLYICVEPGERLEGPYGVQIRGISGNGKLTGIGTWLCGYELILSMTGFPLRRFENRRVAYRLLEFYATGWEYEKSVILSWHGLADLGTVKLNIGK